MLAVRQTLASLALSGPEAGFRVVGALLSGVEEPGLDIEVPVLGGLDNLADVARRHDIEQLLVVLPASMRGRTSEIGVMADRIGLAWRSLPTLNDQLLHRSATASGGSAGLDLQALIGREVRPLDEGSLRSTLTDKVVLVTGAAGSIGSELARLAAGYGPSMLVLADRSENGLFQIDGELARSHPGVLRRAQIHDVTHRTATRTLFGTYQPDVVLHAAAHKHVPLMEDHPSAAVENNFYGTRWVVDAAIDAGVDRMVMISTDKAVNPSSVMGASKRLAELYIQHRSADSPTTLAMVRFGNVLGSACSVLPIWAEQLSRGGPLTVTHPEMTRYFMTIPEAAGLVLQAAGYAQGGEVFLLDMGEPIRVLDLAKRYLQQQGLEADVDVPIRITGPRPGEKLFEELAYDSEAMTPTEHERIRIWQTTPPDAASMSQVFRTFDRLRDGSGAGPWDGTSQEAVATALRQAIPEMVRAIAG
ncbi:polysaccharide biosynthesis protein [Mucisphaera sp.]|uniref:polysaccharide biosynthesis protein n=1 Tax=Mucisphaera sp. TaxID=2913024 RepID=UPI003D118266